MQDRTDTFKHGLFTFAFSFPAQGTILIRLVAPTSNNVFHRRTFDIRVTQDARIAQGDSTVVVAGPGTVAYANTAGGRYLKSTERWRIDVDKIGEEYLSIMSGAGVAGVLEIGSISDIPAAKDNVVLI